MEVELTLKGGVETQPHTYVGSIHSSELANYFNKSWIPAYQRGRVERESKIKGIKEVLNKKGDVGSIKLHIEGEIEPLYSGKRVVKGKVSVIDGQQRLFALSELGDIDYSMSVELHMNKSLDEQIEIFRRINKDGTKLTANDLLKSCAGTFGDQIRIYMKARNLAIPVTNTHKGGLDFSTVAKCLKAIHDYLYPIRYNARYTYSSASVGVLIKFCEMEVEERKRQQVDYIFRNLIAEYVTLAGTFDSTAKAYNKNLFLSWFRVFLFKFVEDSGNIEMQGFRSKVEITFRKTLKSSQLQEMLMRTGNTVQSAVYDLIVEELNKGIRKDERKLMSIKELQEYEQVKTKSEQKYGDLEQQ